MPNKIKNPHNKLYNHNLSSQVEADIYSDFKDTAFKNMIIKELKRVPEQFFESVWLLLILNGFPCILPFKLLVVKDTSKWVLDVTKVD